MNKNRLTSNNELWVLALAASVTVVGLSYLLYPRCLGNERHKTRVDGNAEKLYKEISDKLSKVLEIPTEDILNILKSSESTDSEKVRKVPLRLECRFTKLSPNNIKIHIDALYIKSNTPYSTSLTKEIAWDEVPQDVRSEFIHSGKVELIYVLGGAETPANY